ncbi:Protein ABA DEFICIENT 4, chloroplastic [Linum perenne]
MHMHRLRGHRISSIPIMAFSLSPQVSLFPTPFHKAPESPSSVMHCTSTELTGHFSRRRVCMLYSSFLGGSSSRSRFGGLSRRRRRPVCAGWMTIGSPTAGEVFGFGTAAVLPFYFLMILAPKSHLTKMCMKSRITDVVLGVLYGYAVYLSWTPDTFHLMFSGQNGMPQLSGIVKIFSSEMRLTSGWIHMVVVDLFAAREVYKDGLENEIETRHSVVMCLLACPFGIFTHFLTKALLATTANNKHPPLKEFDLTVLDGKHKKRNLEDGNQGRRESVRTKE